mmetsp:Transcript_3107/g.11900  ORF Transcript_3107/g.11900 Transcript_3107/m.11900 type:complete len:206 (+) Transcript_3107:3413-4030(+)
MHGRNCKVWSEIFLVPLEFDTDISIVFQNHLLGDLGILNHHTKRNNVRIQFDFNSLAASENSREFLLLSFNNGIQFFGETLKSRLWIEGQWNVCNLSRFQYKWLPHVHRDEILPQVILFPCKSNGGWNLALVLHSDALGGGFSYTKCTKRNILGTLWCKINAHWCSFSLQNDRNLVQPIHVERDGFSIFFVLAWHKDALNLGRFS